MKNFTLFLISVILIIGMVACQPQEVVENSSTDTFIVSLTQEEKEVLGFKSDEIKLETIPEEKMDFTRNNDNTLMVKSFNSDEKEYDIVEVFVDKIFSIMGKKNIDENCDIETNRGYCSTTISGGFMTGIIETDEDEIIVVTAERVMIIRTTCSNAPSTTTVIFFDR